MADRVRGIAVFCGVAMCATQGFAEGFSFESPVGRAQLVQLFTSEGCSSCPPADAFLSTLVDREDLWSAVVPIALHVDYWDHIGWKDPYASPRYSQLQQAYAQQCGIENAYTPNFFVDGKEWRGFFEGEALPQPRSETSGVLNLRSDDGTTVLVRYTPEKASLEDLVVFVAVVGFGCESSIDAGENKGRNVTHEFVALSLQGGKLNRDGAAFVGSFDLAETAPVNAARYGIVAWVAGAANSIPVQATGGFLR